MLKFATILLACAAAVAAAAASLANPSFETGGGWTVEGEGGMAALTVYGPVPDGEHVMHFRESVWQNTGIELAPGQNWRLTFQAASYGTLGMTVEFRGAATPDGPGTTLLAREVIAFDPGQVWAYRDDVPEQERFFRSCTVEFPVTELPAGAEYLAVAFVSGEGFAAIDDVKLELTPPAVTVLPLKGSLAAAAAEYCGVAGDFLGGEGIGIYWAGDRPLALALRDGDRALIKAWEGGKFWELALDDGTVYSNLDAGPPHLGGDGGARTLFWCVGSVDVSVTVAPRPDGRSLEFGFALDNRSKAEIGNFILPAGWREAVRGQGEWIIPAWVGAAAPMNNLETVHVLYPGHLHSQWYGFRDRSGFSWMVHSEDTEPSTKFLKIWPDGNVNESSWLHDVYLKPGRSYRASYPTVLTGFASGDWNDMAKTYRAWAKTAPWFTPLAAKAAVRPEILRLRQGWSWLRGMPPVKEVNGRQCDTTYLQALECMDGFERRFGIKPLFWYTGWYGPFDSKYPEFFPVAPEMGGSVEEFARVSAERGNLVALHINGGEWNSSADVFDRDKMARWKGRFYENSYGDDHSNFVVSYPCVEPVMVEYTDRIGNGLKLGIYYDVMGHVYAHDDNPAAGYDSDTIGRSNWNLAKQHAWRAVRQAAPEAYFQTEAAAEQAIPYVDCPSGGMIGWTMTGGRRTLPLWQLTYGDTGFYIPLYDGQGQANCSAGFTLTPLMAAIQQFPQDSWETLEPYWIYIIRRQRLNGELAGTEQLSYIEQDGLRLGRWPEGAVAVNDGPVCDVVLDGAGRSVTFREMGLNPEMRRRGAGSTAMFNARGFSLDCGRAVEEGGAVLWQAPDPETGVVVYEDRMLLFNGTDRPIAGEFRVAWPAFCQGETLYRRDFAGGSESEQPFRRDGAAILLDLTLEPGSVIEIRSQITPGK